MTGRPPKYKTAKELQAKIDNYFAGGYRKRKIYTEKKIYEVPDITITDLVLFLGFCDRQSFYEYEKIPKFTHTIKKARSFIVREYEALLKQGNCAGAIFALKNFGWTDRQDLQILGDPDKPLRWQIEIVEAKHEREES